MAEQKIRLRNKRRAYVHRKFHGGLNVKDSPMEIDASQSPDEQNMVGTAKGAIATRSGCVRYTPIPIGAGGVTWGIEWRMDDGSVHRLAAFNDGTEIRKEGDTPGVYDTVLRSGLTAGTRIRAAGFRNKLYLVNGADTNMVYDGETIEDMPGDPPIASLIAVRGYFLFLAGDPENPSKLYHSGLDDPESWPGTHYIMISDGDGDRITGLAEFGNELVIWKQRKMFKLLGDTKATFLLRPIPTEYGCVAPDTIVPVRNTLFWLDRRTICGYDGAQVVDLAEQLQPLVAELNAAELERACAIHYDSHYLLAVPESAGAGNDLILAFDYQHRAWHPWRGLRAETARFWTHTENGLELLMAGHPDTGMIYRHGVGEDDDGELIECWWTPGYWDMGTDAEKVFYSHHVLAKVQQGEAFIRVEVDQDFAGMGDAGTIDMTGVTSFWDVSFWDEAVWDGHESARRVQQDFRFQASFLRPRYSNIDGRPMAIHRIRLHYIELPLK